MISSCPSWLLFPDERGDLPLDLAGVLIARPREHQWHTGILYREDEVLQLLHLRWHLDLKADIAPTEYPWACVCLPLDPELLEPLVALCQRVSNLLKRGQGPRIPYALRYWETTFGLTGDLLLGPQEHGLTCATFVLAMIRTFFPGFIALESWPLREEDRRWQEQVAKLLQRQLVAQEVGSLRYRPEEVAGACACTCFPVRYKEAAAAAHQIKGMFEPPPTSV